MKKLYFSLLCAAMLLLAQPSFAQGLVSVNNFTGTANVSIPLYEISSGSVKVPVSVSYNTSGLRVKDIEGSAGMGWNVGLGGGVYRTVRGLPDDAKKDLSNNDRKGWLYNDDLAKIAAFNIQTSSYPDCTAEAADVSYINSNFSALNDTEPDVYNVSAPGLSCRLYPDASKTFRISPYRDYKVDVTYDSSSGQISKFTITNDQGTAYVFNVTETETRTVNASGTPSYYTRDHNYYRYGLTFIRAWKLNTITDVRGNLVKFGYTMAKNTARTTPFKLAMGGSSTATQQYSIYSAMSVSSLEKVYTGSAIDTLRPVLTVSYTSYARTGDIAYKLSGYGREVVFTYSSVKNRDPLSEYYRQFLRQIDFGDRQVAFTYKKLVYAPYPVISLPDSSTFKMDLWGYYTGSANTSLISKVFVNPSNSSYERYRNLDPGANTSYQYTIAGADRPAVPDSAMTGSSTLSSTLAGALPCWSTSPTAITTRPRAPTSTAEACASGR